VRKQNLFELTAEVRNIIKELPIIVGSQAIFAITNFPPEIVRRSVECDYLLRNNFSNLRPYLTEQLGIFSNYQQEKGFFADILGLATVVLPEGWEQRLVELRNETDEVIAFCLEIHDVAVSKLMAGREKDFEFLQIAFQSDYLEIEAFLERTNLMLDSPSSQALLSRLKKLIEKFEKEKELREITNKIRELKDNIETR
jgi:uncharacterized protein YihD (DUF1040 family)